MIFNLPFRDSTGFSRAWNSSLHKSQDVRAESPRLTDDLCGKVLILAGHRFACPPQLAFPAALSPSLSFTLPAGYLVTQASAEFISFTHIAQALHTWVHVTCHITRETPETEFYQWVYQNSSWMGKRHTFQNTSLWIKISLKILLVGLTQKPV